MGSPVCCEACLTGLYGRPCTCDPSQWATAWDRIAADVITRHAATLERLAMTDRMRTLAANLAAGGALCANWTRGHNVGFDVGWSDARHQYLGMTKYEPDDEWRPGCGRAWGGGE